MIRSRPLPHQLRHVPPRNLQRPPLPELWSAPAAPEPPEPPSLPRSGLGDAFWSGVLTALGVVGQLLVIVAST